VKRLPIIALLGLLLLEACSAGGDPAEHEEVDAGRDAKTTPRADAPADQLDASGGSYADEASTPPDPDVVEPDTISPPMDAVVPPPDVPVSPPDAPAADGSSPPQPDAPPPPPVDAPPDQAVLSCLVTFTVNGVQWDPPEGGAPDAQVSGRVVRLVGDAANIGSWSPTAGVLLAEIAPGTWSGTATFRDQQLTEFKFVKLEGTTPQWEGWQPYDSNRSLRVECLDDAGVLRDASDVTASDATSTDGSSADGAIDAQDGGMTSSDALGDTASHDATSDSASDASTDGGADVPADANDAAPEGGIIDDGSPSDGRVIPVPARGRTYAGTFGVRPGDATK
jgi:hypothetical protein